MTDWQEVVNDFEQCGTEEFSRKEVGLLIEHINELSGAVSEGVRQGECTCHSYNWDIGTTPAVELMPYGGTRTVCIDACISTVMTSLWNEDIVTRGSCCGHNRLAPSVIVEHDHQVVQTCRILQELDPSRHWNVGVYRLQWVPAFYGGKST